MQRYLAAATLILVVGIVSSRVLLLKRRGIKAMNFGAIDKSDFLIPPFALFYFYLVFAAAFRWPTVSTQRFFDSPMVAWLGVCLCLAGLSLIVASLISFGTSFRVGIDTQRSDALATGGVFGMSRNPMYVAFATILAGQFLIFPNWILLAYLVAASWLFNRQVLREEEYLEQRYGQDYLDYCARVPRYL